MPSCRTPFNVVCSLHWSVSCRQTRHTWCHLITFDYTWLFRQFLVHRWWSKPFGLASFRLQCHPRPHLCHDHLCDGCGGRCCALKEAQLQSVLEKMQMFFIDKSGRVSCKSLRTKRYSMIHTFLKKIIIMFYHLSRVKKRLHWDSSVCFPWPHDFIPTAPHCISSFCWGPDNLSCPVGKTSWRFFTPGGDVNVVPEFNVL